ncbi:MAG: Mov34/MPN/PAD-1 family protein [Methylobacter sp.]|nr:Mov34/MPN/PAD-1 family protein [Methylobacter sp.]MDP2098908.1 Mov34/MPN/PAD-1 family protein [Methylobacter sp.]MDP2426533.1 Mov34/MPN/PAD-1 family protein [Methylobacter sp.]MDP3053114.1 Mov34/MPN/PAD-1 family protein [Methylobacter sp.]MDP3361372.1 Mov34/MPN/PAD-1 family protein [Methylobacter sp.]
MGDENAIFKNGGISLNISKDALAVWKNHRQINAKDHEKFGVIIGSCSEIKDEYWVESITTPFPNDRSTRYSFLLRDRNHQKAVDLAFVESGGTSIYLGTWHTHPELIPTPSLIDKMDWLSCIGKNPGRQLFFVIVGTKEIRVFVRTSFGFTKLIMES